MRILVTVASRHGATGEIADRIAERLAERHGEVVQLPPERVQELDGFDVVILGSALYAGRWMSDARDFVERFGDELSGVTVWTFSSGPVGDPLFPKEEPAEPVALSATIGAREHRVFAGKVDRSALTLPERAIMKVLRAPEGDFRDWEAVDAWAEVIARASSDLAEGD